MELAIVGGLLVVGIAIVTSYSVGYDAALGKPKTEEHMRPGTRYAHGYGFTEVGPNGTQRRVAVLHNLESGWAEFCAPKEPIPAAQLIAVIGDDGRIRLQPAPETHIDVIT